MSKNFQHFATSPSPAPGCYWLYTKWPANRSYCILTFELFSYLQGMCWCELGKNFLEHPVRFLGWHQCDCSLQRDELQCNSGNLPRSEVTTCFNSLCVFRRHSIPINDVFPHSVRTPFHTYVYIFIYFFACSENIFLTALFLRSGQNVH